MPINNTWYTESNKIGCDLLYPETILSSDPSVPAPKAKLGDCIKGNLNSEWMFVQAGAAIPRNTVVSINNNNIAVPALTGMATPLANTFGIATVQQATILNGDYFWVLLSASGGVPVIVTGAVVVGQLVYLTATPGTVSTAVLTVPLKNMYAVTANASGTATLEFVIPSRIIAST